MEMIDGKTGYGRSMWELAGLKMEEAYDFEGIV
jgi:hypothetical protein